MNLKSLSYHGRKAAYKTFWRMTSAATPTPSIETIFQRSTNGHGPDLVRRLSEPSIIEPDWGYVITSSGHILEESLSFNHPVGTRPFASGIPSPRHYASARSSSSLVSPLYDSVVSLRHLFEGNYFHFIVDLLGELELLDSSGLSPDIPIVVGSEGSSGFGKEMLELGQLASRNWIVQQGSPVRAKTVIFLRTYQKSGARTKHLLELFGVPSGGTRGDDRLFLTRPQSVGRTLVNSEEVATVMAANGFRSVVTDSLSVRDQIHLFQNARYIVGAHGAGLTNVIYRRGAPLGVLELHAQRWVTEAYSDICSQYGFYHDYLGCAGGLAKVPHPGRSDLLVDPVALDMKIRRMLERG
jgi:capsular polysaccharide biosynthesis protein